MGVYRQLRGSYFGDEGADGMNPIFGDFNIPLTGRELLFQLSNDVTVQIGRSFLSKALLLVERCASAEIDVQTDGGEAYLTPRKCELNDEGKAYIANAGIERPMKPQKEA